MNQAEAKRRQAEAFSNICMLFTIYVFGRLIGNNGITYLAVAVEASAMLWQAASGSVSDALGRQLRSRKNKGQYNNIQKMRRCAMAFHGALGLVGSLILLASAWALAEKVFRIPYSALILALLSPMVLLRSVSSVLLGYFQGEGWEFPRIVSGILRQVFILGFGILFGNIFSSYGEKVSRLERQANFEQMYGGMGIALSISIAEILVILLLVIIFKGSRRFERKAKTKPETAFSADSTWDCIRYLSIGRWPQVATGFLLLLPLPLGLGLFVGRMWEDAQAVSAYGMYAGKYLVICGVMVSLMVMVSIPVISRMFLCFKRDENRFARTVFQSGVHVCMLHGFYASVFMAVLGPQVAGLLCPEEMEPLARMLEGGAFVIVLGALSAYFGRILHVMGKRYHMLGAACGAVAFFSITVILSAEKAGILSLVYGGLVGVFALCISWGFFAYRQMRMRVDWLNVLAVPVGAGGVAGLICFLIRKLLSPYLGDVATLLMALAVSGALYWILLLLLRNIKEQELEVIPGRRLISMLGQLLRVY